VTIGHGEGRWNVSIKNMAPQDLSNLISGISLIVNMVLTGTIIYISNQTSNSNKKSAIAAEQSNQFNQEIAAKQRAENILLSEVYMNKVKKDAKYLYETVFGQSINFNYLSLKQAKQIASPAAYELIHFVDPRYHKIIEEIWQDYTDYYGEYWMDEFGEVDRNMKGNEPEIVKRESKIVAERIESKLTKL
jgi:hypothetical protein